MQEKLSNVDSEKERWNYKPSGKVELNPMFARPFNIRAIFDWYASYWFQLSTTTLAFILALIAWFVFFPSVSSFERLNWESYGTLYLLNLIPHCFFAGSIHYWLYRKKGQDKKFKFDKRDPAKDNGVYTFRDQVKDNMFWTICSGITIWTFFQAIVLWAMANGFAPVLTFSESPILFILVFPALVVWASFHFYWIHRFLHWPPMYRIAHALHHRNVNVGPWSGISMHPIEHFLFYTNFLVHFILASSPLHLMFHGYMQSIHPIFSHSGFEKLYVANKERANMGDFFHQLHHRYFECNYGTVEMPWDRWFGSFHDGTAQATADTRARKKRMYES